MDKIFAKYGDFWNHRQMHLRLLMSVFLLFISIGVTYFASSYTENYKGYVVPDLLLDHIPVMSVQIVFFQGAAAFILALLGLLLLNPKFFPFVFEASALFYFIRSIFMIMTHLTAPSVAYYSYIQHEHHVSETLFTISSGNDLFFSGHAGFPFLMMFIFWRNVFLRYFFLGCSIIGAVAVIFGHLHYSIDVFSAYFIAFGIFEISKRFFRHEYELTRT